MSFDICILFSFLCFFIAYILFQNNKLKQKIRKEELEELQEEIERKDREQSKRVFDSHLVVQNYGKKVIGITGSGEMCVAIFKGFEYFDHSVDQKGIPILLTESGETMIHWGKVFLHTQQLERILSAMSVPDRKAVIWSTYPVGHHMSGIEYN